MTLLIDGYNLLHASGILARGVGPGTLERARQALLNFLAASLTAEEAAQTIIVFDAREAPPDRPRIYKQRGLQVHFAPNPGDADEAIENLIRADSSPKRLTVVSSDHRLQRAARRRKAQPVDSDRWFAELLQRRLQRNRQPDEADVKPAPPSEQHEINFWLRAFGAAEPDRDARAPAAESPSGEETPRRAAPDETPRRAAPDGGPFPPGYAEDLREEDV